MGFIRRLFYLSTTQKLPRLRHHLTNGRRLDEADDNSHMLLEAGLVRDWSGGRHLIQKYHKTAEELFWALSKRRKANWRKRLRNQFIRFFGAYTTNPHGAELKRLSKGIYEHDGTYTRTHRINPSHRGSDIFPHRS